MASEGAPMPDDTMKPPDTCTEPWAVGLFQWLPMVLLIVHLGCHVFRLFDKMPKWILPLLNIVGSIICLSVVVATFPKLMSDHYTLQGIVNVAMLEMWATYYFITETHLFFDMIERVDNARNRGRKRWWAFVIVQLVITILILIWQGIYPLCLDFMGVPADPGPAEAALGVITIVFTGIGMCVVIGGNIAGVVFFSQTYRNARKFKKKMSGSKQANLNTLLLMMVSVVLTQLSSLAGIANYPMIEGVPEEVKMFASIFRIIDCLISLGLSIVIFKRILDANFAATRSTTQTGGKFKSSSGGTSKSHRPSASSKPSIKAGDSVVVTFEGGIDSDDDHDMSAVGSASNINLMGKEAGEAS